MNISESLTRSFGRGKVVLAKHSPEILLGVGLLGMVATVVLAVRAAKEDNVKQHHEINMKNADHIIAENNFSKEEEMKVRAAILVGTGVEYVKIYGPSIGLGVLSISTILASHGIMANRQVALVAAYNMVAGTLKEYRARVAEELGEEADKMFLHGYSESEEKILDEETGKKVTKKVVSQDPNWKSEYAVYFDRSSIQWKDEPMLNVAFLKRQEQYANDVLNINGVLFLNDVYKSLGLPITSAGQIVGWVARNTGDNDQYVKFNMYLPENLSGRSLMNSEDGIAVDFNVDGIVYDKI